MTHEKSDRLLRTACDFRGKSLVTREVCREQFRRAERNEDNVLRILIDGQLGLLAEKMTQQLAAPTETMSYQIGVCASFIRTHYLLSDLIINGDLVEAITLTRKQLESLARLHELDSKPLQKLSRRVPNIHNVLGGPAARMYGDLSEVAHFSTPRVAELLHVSERGELVGPSLFPVFTPNAAAVFDMEHFIAVYFIAWMIEQLPVWYPAYDNSEDKTLLAETVMLALEGGVLRPSEA